MTDLLNAIVTHIFHNLKFLDIESKQSICNNNFLSNQTINFEDEDLVAKIYGVQSLIQSQKFKIAAANVYGSDSPDGLFAFAVQMQDCPTYGCSGFYTDYKKPYDIIEESYLAYQIPNSDNWLMSTPFLQGTFLAGMEQLKEMNISFNKMDNNDELFDVLKKFVIHCQEIEG
jgi:hypothetical protein